MSTAIARIEDVTSRPLATVDDLRRTLDALRDRANVLSPIAAVNHVKQLHQISLRMVVIDPETDCYQDKRFCKDNEFALGGVALQKLMAAAGANVVGRVRLDDRSDPHYCEIEVYVAVQDFDGAWRQMVGTKELDLRDGSEDAKNMLPKELSNARKHIQSLCETKATYRAVRKLFSLRQKYSKADLARPWVVPKLVPHLDLSDPDQKAAAIAEATSQTRALFGPAPGETRTMRDITPPALEPAKEPKAPPPVGRSREPGEDDMEDDDGQASFDLPDFTPGPPAPVAAALVLCLCPCGHQEEISEAVAKATTEKVGAPRCATCFPGRLFAYERHRDLPRGLGLPKYPALTADGVKAANERAAAGRK